MRRRDDDDARLRKAIARARPWLAECRHRRCVVCGEREPSFGFGPPLVPAGKPMIWACRRHREEVTRNLEQQK